MYQQNPIDHARERQEKGEDPFRDAKEQLRESEAELQRKAAPGTETDRTESAEERTAKQESEASERFEQIAEDVADKSPGS